MKARAKSSKTPHPIWIYGEYITSPPIRPKDKAKRPKGHYIDEGGYPGVNVYEVDITTLCIKTAAVDGMGKEIYTKDFVLCKAQGEIQYFVIADEETATDILWGEAIPLHSLHTNDIKVIGNTIDCPDFIEGMGFYKDNKIKMPYIPSLNVQTSAFPYLKLECTECKNAVLSCRYQAKCKHCGGFLKIGFATKI